jgi:heme O synthase-like polyprenyltransferase
MGWTAAHNSIDAPAWLLFAMLFCWQIPHFLSLAWMYRKDYERAGYRLLTVSDPAGRRTALTSLLFLVLLIPVSLWLAGAGNLGAWYVAGAAASGGGFAVTGIRFLHNRSNPAARILFFASLFYFPALFLFMILDRVL